MTHWPELLMLIAAAIHVAEEAMSGWLEWARHFVPGVTKLQFWIMNLLFLSICAGACLARASFFTQMLASLIFVNALVHIVPTVVQRKRSPGVISALLLYLPISSITFWWLLRTHQTRGLTAAAAFLCGTALMAVPFLFQAFVRYRLGRR